MNYVDSHTPVRTRAIRLLYGIFMFHCTSVRMSNVCRKRHHTDAVAGGFGVGVGRARFGDAERGIGAAAVGASRQPEHVRPRAHPDSPPETLVSPRLSSSSSSNNTPFFPIMSLQTVVEDIRDEARARAQEISDAADERAEEIIADAEADADQIREEREAEVERTIEQEREQRLSSASSRPNRLDSTPGGHPRRRSRRRRGRACGPRRGQTRGTDTRTADAAVDELDDATSCRCMAVRRTSRFSRMYSMTTTARRTPVSGIASAASSSRATSRESV